MASSAAGEGEADFAALIAALADFRANRLGGQPSDRTLAKIAQVSPTTVGKWLRGDRFPQRIDPVLALLSAVRGQAEHAGPMHGGEAALLEAGRWRAAYMAEAGRLAEGTRTAVQAEQGRAALERSRPGRPLGEVRDPFALEVHRAIDSPTAGLPALPAYVERAHDRVLGEVVAQAAAGTSQIAVLVGGSSTGKTRACWQALRPLRERFPGWRLWHPIDPTRADATLAELGRIGPSTVVWLNEAQFYLADPALGERVAAGLRELLRDPDRVPVLILATLWLNHWDTLTTRSGPDAHAQARELLDGHKIRVPDAFTGADLDALAQRAEVDPRLKEAAGHARDGQITQYLAGVPVLMDRYRDAVPATKAVIHAAMDARRLGCGPHLSLALLAGAAPGYLSDTEWDHTGQDWLRHALDYVTTPCNGIPGILTAVPGTPRNQRTGPSTTAQSQAGSGPIYRLADYLDQHGRHQRTEQIEPIDFWTAAAAHAHLSDLGALGYAAWRRGLYRDASQLYKHAAAHGNPADAAALVDHVHAVHPGDHRPAQWAATHAVCDNPYAVAELLKVLRKAGAGEQVTALAERAVTHVSLDNPAAVASLLNTLREAGAEQQMSALLARDPAVHVALKKPSSVADLLVALREGGAGEQVATLAARAAANITFHSPYAVAELLKALRQTGVGEQVAILAERAAADTSLSSPHDLADLLVALQEAGASEKAERLLSRTLPTSIATASHTLDHPRAVARLLRTLRKAGADEHVTAVAARAAAAHTLDHPGAVATLLDALREAGADEQVNTLLARDPATYVALDPQGVARLLVALREAEAGEQVAALAKRAVAHVSLDNPAAVASLLNGLREARADEQTSALLARDPGAHAPLNHPYGAAALLNALRNAGASEQVGALLARCPAAHADLEPYGVARLLDVLRELGEHEQVTGLAKRAATHIPISHPSATARLLEALRLAEENEQVTVLAKRAASHTTFRKSKHLVGLLDALQSAGMSQEVTVLAQRLPAAGRFDRYLEIGNHRERFRFGREPDGNAAAPWTWDDLQ
ncbi:hypothetical protein Acor_24380 [Acrocarpospora corrugata]|uniref:Uncharacterized protein n=1 Tax=Acrocarpospora corrugata TaxID=35763 RepID=A0A5M3VV40_9ACTN|nr:hypothetical protein [Acrocarpospora corrugata]GES00374.1 hypothetical protein Acor_24380 [Acrocarpospora corrugata]